MSKPFLLFRGPVSSVSGYGAHSRDLLMSLYEMNIYDIKIDSCPWGDTPLNALHDDNLFHLWVKSNVVKGISQRPHIYIQVSVPNEFMRVGEFNIGITAGIETTVAPKDWLDGCNRMDLIITTSKFSKDILKSTIYNEVENISKKIVDTKMVTKPIEILFEGVDTSVYKKNEEVLDTSLNQKLNSIKENFCFLFVGHWLRGSLGNDRKDVGMLIKSFAKAFNGVQDKPALILKTSSATFSVRERENLKKRINSLLNEFDNPPSVYLLFGELTDNEMNDLYNHKKVKSMVSITKGEGFGRPLLEFSLVGKPIIASNWSGHKDFLSEKNCILVGGKLTEVDDSAVDNFILKGSKWFTVDYDMFVEMLRHFYKKYDDYIEKSTNLMYINQEYFSFEKMTETFKNILEKYTVKPKEHKIILPKSFYSDKSNTE